MASGPSKDSRPASPPERLTLRFSTSFWGKSPFSSPDNIEPNTKSDHKSPQSASQRLTYLIFYDTKWDFLSRSLASTKPDPAQILVSLSSTVRPHSFSSQPEVSWEKISALKGTIISQIFPYAIRSKGRHRVESPLPSLSMLTSCLLLNKDHGILFQTTLTEADPHPLLLPQTGPACLNMFLPDPVSIPARSSGHSAVDLSTDGKFKVSLC